MRVESLMILHYGLDYITYALRSIYDHVDRIHVVYTPHPSHGTQTTLTPPDSRQALKTAATIVGPKVQWHDVDRFYQEGQHRDYALSLCRGDLALVIDADEVWHPHVLEAALKHAYDRASSRTWLVNCKTLWRSFRWLCTDNMWPVRIIDLRQDKDSGLAYMPQEIAQFWHFGYAVTDKIVRYKRAIHGHVGEWRQGWYETKWDVWPPQPDCHPTCEDTWYPQPFDRKLLPEVMWGHPFFNVEGPIK